MVAFMLNYWGARRVLYGHEELYHYKCVRNGRNIHIICIFLGDRSISIGHKIRRGERILADVLRQENQISTETNKEKFLTENADTLAGFEAGIYEEIDRAILASLPEHSFTRKENEYFLCLTFDAKPFVKSAFEVIAQTSNEADLSSLDRLRFSLCSQWEGCFPEISYSELTREQLVKNSVDLFIKITAHLAYNRKTLGDSLGNRDTLVQLEEYKRLEYAGSNNNYISNKALSMDASAEDWEELKRFIRYASWIFVIFIVLFLFYAFSL